MGHANGGEHGHRERRVGDERHRCWPTARGHTEAQYPADDQPPRERGHLEDREKVLDQRPGLHAEEVDPGEDDQIKNPSELLGRDPG